jgi:protein-S-isoprenylcysteine O-methyltransferase Ste14
VHHLLWFVLLLAISDCEATTLPGYSVHSSLRMGSHSHTAAEPWAPLQFGNHSIGQYACQGALRPTFIVGLPSCFVFGCGLVLFLRELKKRRQNEFLSKGCKKVLEWFAVCFAVFFVILLGFTIACVKTHKDTGIDKDFYITAFAVVLYLLLILCGIGDENGSDVWGEPNVWEANDGKERLAQAGVSVFGVCTGLFVVVMVLRSDHGVRLDQHTTAPIAYSFYMVFLSGVWCIGWALWRSHCSSNAEVIRIKDEECGNSIPFNVTGLMQVPSLLFSTYSFAGFSFAPSIPWTNASSSISFAPILAPVTQWYSNYVSYIA